MKIKHLITKKGIQVLPSKTEDHRIITKVLDEAKYQYSVFKLPEEKTLKPSKRDYRDSKTKPDGLELISLKDYLLTML